MQETSNVAQAVVVDDGTGQEIGSIEPVAETQTQQLTEEQQLQHAYGIAAATVKSQAPVLKEKLKQLSTGELRRLVLSLTLHPVEEADIIDGTSSQALKDCFDVGNGILEAKMLLVLATMTDRAIKEETKKEEGETVNGQVES